MSYRNLPKQFALQPTHRPRIRAIVYVSVVLCRIARKAKWLNVVYVACAALADWLNMVCRQLHIAAPTFQTFVTVMSTKGLPLSGGIRAAGFSLASAAPMGDCVYLIGISHLPSANKLLAYSGVILIPPALILSQLVWVGLFPPAICFRSYFRVGLTIALVAFGYLVGVILLPFACLFALALFASSPLVPLACSALLARFSVLSAHNQKISLPVSPIRRLRLQSLSGRLLRPHTPKLLAQLSGFFRSFTPVIIPKYTSGVYLGILPAWARG